jgi:hypothetical protein
MKATRKDSTVIDTLATWKKVVAAKQTSNGPFQGHIYYYKEVELTFLLTLLFKGMLARVHIQLAAARSPFP